MIKDFSFPSPTFFMPKQSHIGENSFDLYTKSIKKKNQDLENIFSRLMAKSILPNDVKFDFKDLDSSFIPDEGVNLNINELSLENQISIDKNATLSYQEILPAQNFSLLDSLTHANFDEDIFYDLVDSKESECAIEKIEAHLYAKAVFPQLSFADILDSSSLTSNLDPSVQTIGLNEPILPSSENFFLDDFDPNIKRVIATSSDFMVHVEYAPQLNKEGFIFKLTLSPKPYKHFKRIKQNFFFLIDRSHSISLKSYEAAKEAVSLALDYLHPGDTFNILIFDDKVVKYSNNNISSSPKNISLAKQFLKNQKHGGFFATTDLYSSLDKIIPEAVEEDEVNTAILLSDGDTYINKQKQRKTLNFWSQKNKGKVSLFTLAIGKQNNLPLLDLLSTFNKGTLRIAQSKEGIAHELLTLVQSLHSPIGKDLIVTALPHEPHATIEIYPVQERLPNLYENLEYVLYGTLSQSSDFTLFLQGRYYDHWLDIKKTISLSKGMLADDSSLKKGVLLQKAYLEYEQFLRSGHPKFLDKARKLLEPIQLPLAFE